MNNGYTCGLIIKLKMAGIPKKGASFALKKVK